MKNTILVSLALCAATSLAMPTKDELAKAQTLVTELMAEDVAAFKAKDKKAEEIGDTSVKYAQEATTEAAKFLLLEDAVSYYVRGESYDKAADAVNALREAIPDIPPSVVEEIIRKNTARVTAKKAPRLYAMYRTAQVQAEAVKSVRKAKAALAKAPKDEAAIRKLAEAQALSGDWKSALGTFAQMGNKAGAMAKSETEGKDLAAVADFWWDYESYLGENDADAFKMHAAAIYRKCLADGSIDGLKKKLVENRLKQVKCQDDVLVSTPVVCETKSSPKSVAGGRGGKVWQEKGNMAILTLRNGEKLEFVKCPAGDIYYRIGFLFWEEFVPKTKRARISRPFWIMTRPLAKRNLKMYEQYNSSWQGRDDVYDYVQVDHRKAESFAEAVTGEVRESLPRGSVVRNPSFAEYEYALRANSLAASDPYSNLEDMRGESAKKVFLNDPQGRSIKNKWGLHEFFGKEQLLDKFSEENSMFVYWGKDQRMWPTKQASIHFIRWEPNLAVDPLVWTENPDRLPAWRRLDRCSGIVMTDMSAIGQCRLVVGPDLVSEWKAKHGKK